MERRTKRIASEDIIWPTASSQPKENETTHNVDDSSEGEVLNEYAKALSYDNSTHRMSFSSKGRTSENKGKTEKRTSIASRRKSRRNPDDVEARISPGTVRSLNSFQARHRTSLAVSRRFRQDDTAADNFSQILDWTSITGVRHQGGFDLEAWWARTDITQRILVALVAVFLVMFLVNFAFAVWLFATHFREVIRSPYLCETVECDKAAVWISRTMDTSLDPCDNFYEFVCANYEHETEKKGTEFTSVIKSPAFPLGFGENSLLARILTHYEHDVVHDQTIHYYQACLNFPKRKDFGIVAFIDVVEEVFGTRDFSNFESTSLSMEQIGTKMFKVAGHASFINMAFFSYPHIQILRPSKFVLNLHFDKTVADKPSVSWHNEDFVRRIFEGLIPSLGVHQPIYADILADVISGVKVMTEIIHKIRVTFAKDKLDKDLDTLLRDSSVSAKMKSEFIDTGWCPPMGIQLDTMKVLNDFVGEKDFRLDFFDLMATKYFAVLKMCFSQDPAKFTVAKFKYPKTAFVGLWLIDLFWHYNIEMDSQNILKTWNITPTDFPDNTFVTVRFEFMSHDVEFICLIALYRNLGYMPSMHYLYYVTSRPTELIWDTQVEITDVFTKFSDFFNRLPSTEIDTVKAHLSKIQFARGMLIDVGLPMISGILDETAIDDPLHFTEDHLSNSIIGTKYTIEKARRNWIGSTNADATMKWWGFGSPSDMRKELLDLREPMHMPALFKETTYPGANTGNWEKFLGKGYPNYILYPLSLIAEPHVSETLSIYHAGFVLKLLRSCLSIIEHQFFDDRYPALDDNDFYWFGKPETDNGGDRKCNVLYNEYPDAPPNLRFKYEMTPYTMFDFSWKASANHFSVLSVKEALYMFHRQRSELLKLPFDWSLPSRQRNMRMRRFLPGKPMSAFTEEQLFFITYVRHVCRGSWKTHNDTHKIDRWWLETEILCILMQTEEFQAAWKCKNGAFMSNKGLPRCIRWLRS